MRTTIHLADDVAAAVQRLRRDQSVGLSEAVNELVRAGLAVEHQRTEFAQVTHDLGRSRIDYRDIGDALEALEDPAPPNAR